MGQYRYSRNIEASIIDYLATELNGHFTNINVEKTFARVEELDLPTVCVRVGITAHDPAEVGSNATVRTPEVLIDIFATSDGQRLDLKDFIIEKLKGGCPYYDYTIINGAVDTKTANGRIRILNIDDIPVNADADKNQLDVHDRYRHLLTLTISLGRLEA